MASIQTKGNKTYVVYWAVNSVTGKNEQFWDPVEEDQAEIRKLEVEYEKAKNIFVPRNIQRINEYLDIFVEIYGSANWSPNNYGKNISIINNYVRPLIGNIRIHDFSSLHAAKFLNDLFRVKMVRKDTYCSAQHIEKIGKLMKTAFNQAKIWELILKDPFRETKLPKYDETVKPIWSIDTLQDALDNCYDGTLYTIINLKMSATLRIGEELGLTWDVVDISDEAIESNNARIEVNKQLQRIDKDCLKKVTNFKVILEFPSKVKRKTKTALMLVRPKTKESNRIIWIPRTVAYILRAWKEEQDRMKEFMGREYSDYNLVFALHDGSPMTEGYVYSQFKDFQKEFNLPCVDLHSLRHLSVTYKLILNNGDLKSTQGDVGHASPDMIMKRYAHVVDEYRKGNASRFEQDFYENRRVKNVDTSQKKSNKLDRFIEVLSDDPEMLNKFSLLLKST